MKILTVFFDMLLLLAGVIVWLVISAAIAGLVPQDAGSMAATHL